MSKMERYLQIDALTKILLDLSKLDISSPDYIQQVLDVLSKHFQADCCVWQHTKNRYDYLDLKQYNNITRIKVVPLQSKYGGEALLIINPKIDYELEKFLLDALTDVLENLSKSDFFVSDLKTESFTDSLTRVNNYDAFESSVLKKGSFSNVCVCFIDVNNLGMINNLYGHEAGDKMLVTVAQSLRKYFRVSDVYRKGGDEFIVVCEGMKHDEFMRRLALVKEELAQSEYFISSGVVYQESTNNIEALVNLADTLMYKEKEQFRAANPSKYLAKYGTSKK